MNKIPRFVILSLFLILCAFPAWAQLSISGKITNAASGRPVRQASVSINKKGVGTATNGQGLFALIIPAGNVKDSLKISCVGYTTKYIAIATIKKGEELNVVLTKSTTELGEVTIAYYDADNIIQKAITRIPENYINYRHILRGFYRMYTSTDSIPLQLSETVFDVYNFGYGDTHADLFRLVKARNEKNDHDFNTLEIGQRPNSIFEQDIINHLHACDFLNEEGLKKHQFTVNGVVDFKGYQAYEIEFKEKYGAVEGTYRGKLYIDTKTYAFIYFDFGLSPKALSEVVPGTFIYRSLMRTGATEVGLQFDHTQVSYQEVGNKWVLSGVEGDDSLSVKNPQLKYDYKAQVKYNYQITAVDPTQQESFIAKIGRNDNINAYKSNGDEKFWKDYNIILSDYDVEEVFKKIKAINKIK
ncbi:MAG: carboxypeptidase-like regulatory domain-containing protein [Mucilaginibacter sp.]|nr:carboxypeptidase-like regulatory domain-containing protein [Mucilaginibacter sp.]